MSDIHTLPIGDLVDHDEARSCWCQPRVVKVCPDCDGELAGCWLCDGAGVVPAESGEAVSCLVVHNAVDGRE